VDDEKDLINIFQKMLSGLGYRVTSTLNSIDALEIFKARPEEFDAVITDMTMPQQIGTELARRIKQIRADIPIILSTGYSDLVDEQKAREVGIQAFLMKPVGREMLSKTIRRLLDEKEGLTQN
jgi:CheY-like chemotaxis protein